MPLNNAQTRGSLAPLAQETEQFSSKESVVGANPTRGVLNKTTKNINNNVISIHNMECITCGKSHNNPKFCSRSCAAKWTNVHHPKKKKINFPNDCEVCGVKIDYRSKRCIRCCGSLGDMTLSEAIYEKHHRSSAYALVRTRARAEAKKYNMNSCEKCGYDKHVEIAHKKGISTFTGETLISVINSRENLMALCPNCHWEYDNLDTSKTGTENSQSLT